MPMRRALGTNAAAFGLTGGLGSCRLAEEEEQSLEAKFDAFLETLPESEADRLTDQVATARNDAMRHIMQEHEPPKRPAGRGAPPAGADEGGEGGGEMSAAQKKRAKQKAAAARKKAAAAEAGADASRGAPPDVASIEAMDADSLVATLGEFGSADARLARACFCSLLIKVMDEVARAKLDRQDPASWHIGRCGGLPYVRAVTGAMVAHSGDDEITGTGGMLLAPMLTETKPSRDVLLMGTRALVATLLPRLPVSDRDSFKNVVNPNVALLLGLVAENAAVLFEAGAVSVFEKLKLSRHVPREAKTRAEVAVEIIRDGDITELPETTLEEFQAFEAAKASALAAKQRGTSAFRRGEWETAAGAYGSALLQLERVPSSCDESELRVEKVVLHSNRAEAFLKLDEFQAAREEATAALEIDPAHCKSLHRRARALRQLGPWIGGEAALAGAEADLKELTRLGGGAAAAELLAEVLEVQETMRRYSFQQGNMETTQMLQREREDRLAGPTPFQGLQRR